MCVHSKLNKINYESIGKRLYYIIVIESITLKKL